MNADALNPERKKVWTTFSHEGRKAFDEDGRRVNDDGQFINRDGRPIDGNGKLIDDGKGFEAGASKPKTKDEIRRMVSTARQAWPTPDSMDCFSPDEQLDKLWQAANECGIALAPMEPIVPVGKHPFRIFLYDWIEIPGKKADAWRRYRARIDAVEEALTPRRDSGGKRGRTPGKVKLSSFERQAIRRYCEGAKPSVIDKEILLRKACRGSDKAKKEWRFGDTDLVIRAAKRRGDIRKAGKHWEIVTK